MDAEPTSGRSGRAVTRRGALEGVAALATAMGTLDLAGRLAVVPTRVATAAASIAAAADLPDIQLDIGRYVAPIRDVEGVTQAPPIHTVFLTARLLRRPTRIDQAEMTRALETLEANYPFAAGGLITMIAYGLPYFARLPASLVRSAIPRLRSNTSRSVLTEAGPAPADITESSPDGSSGYGAVPVQIEANDLLFTLRSDDPGLLRDALSWLAGSNRLAGRLVASPAFRGLLSFTSSRAMFCQLGLPRLVATEVRLPFAWFVHPRSPMWLGCADADPAESGPAEACTFAGDPSARLTTARPGDYFDHAGIQHLAHVIVDLKRFYDLQAQHDGNTDIVRPIHRSGIRCAESAPAALVCASNRAAGEYRLSAVPETHGSDPAPGHIGTVAPGMQNHSRLAVGGPRVQWMDGPGFDEVDVPDRRLPKLHCAAFAPTAEVFAATAPLAVDQENGLERLLPATRRQNFLIPPRRHRAFPLIEFS